MKMKTSITKISCWVTIMATAFVTLSPTSAAMAQRPAKQLDIPMAPDRPGPQDRVNTISPGLDGAMMKYPDAQPELTLLRGEEIYSKLVGKTISPDFTIQQVTLDFSEQFFPDGRWVSVRKMRGPVQIEGRWHIKHNKICVEKANVYVKCRNIWKYYDSNYLYISDLGSESSSDKAIRIIVK